MSTGTSCYGTRLRYNLLHLLYKFYLIEYIFFTVPCAIGSYYHKESKTCIPCPLGTYQSESGQLQCLPCPTIAGRPGVTVGPGARSAADCKGMSFAINTIIDTKK